MSIPPKWWLVHRGHRRILSKVSNGILTGFFRPRKHLSKNILQNHFSFEINTTWKPSLKKNVWVVFNFDAVYITLTWLFHIHLQVSKTDANH